MVDGTLKKGLNRGGGLHDRDLAEGHIESEMHKARANLLDSNIHSATRKSLAEHGEALRESEEGDVCALLLGSGTPCGIESMAEDALAPLVHKWRVKDVKMCDISTVFRQLLGVCGSKVLREAVVPPSAIADTRKRLELPERLTALSIMPEQDHAVALHDLVSLHAGPIRDLFTRLGVLDVCALAIGTTEAPAVERALDAVILHNATNGKVCAQVLAVFVHHVGLAIVTSEKDKVHAETADIANLALGKLARQAKVEPTVRERRGIVLGNLLCANSCLAAVNAVVAIRPGTINLMLFTTISKRTAGDQQHVAARNNGNQGDDDLAPCYLGKRRSDPKELVEQDLGVGLDRVRNRARVESERTKGAQHDCDFTST
eukprot:Colp12_sorted_trinity150504_noHs@15657